MKRALIYIAAAAVMLTPFLFLTPGHELIVGAIQTFGQTADNSSVQTNSTDRKYVYSASPSSSGTVTGGVARVWIPTSGTSLSHLVIYADGFGPTNLLAVSDEQTISNRTEQAITYTFSGANQITLTAGTTYWIGEHHSDPGSTNFTYSRANIAGLVRSDVDTYSDGSSDPCSCTTSSSGGLDIYIQYDDAPGGGGGGGTVGPTQSVIMFD